MAQSTLSSETIKMLGCPRCLTDPAAPPKDPIRGELELIGENKLRCKECGNEYPVEDGIPNLIWNEKKS